MSPLAATLLCDPILRTCDARVVTAVIKILADSYPGFYSCKLGSSGFDPGFPTIYPRRGGAALPVGDSISKSDARRVVRHLRRH